MSTTSQPIDPKVFFEESKKKRLADLKPLLRRLQPNQTTLHTFVGYDPDVEVGDGILRREETFKSPCNTVALSLCSWHYVLADNEATHAAFNEYIVEFAVLGKQTTFLLRGETFTAPAGWIVWQWPFTGEFRVTELAALIQEY